MLSQKNPLVILHRLIYNLSRKAAYLKSEIVENGRFWAISGLFLDFVRFCPGRWGGGGAYWFGRRQWVGLIMAPEAMGGA